MASGSGLNHNMNHIIKRIETRVLQPPGGSSSFSIGGYAPETYAPRAPNRQPQAQYSAPSGSGESYANRASKKESQSSTGGRRDSLDELVQYNVPGLEGHYENRRANSNSSMLSAVGVTPSNSKQSSRDYAAQLKAQIDNKASMRQGEYDNPYSRRSPFDNKENSSFGDSRRQCGGPSSRDSYEGSSKRSAHAAAACNDYSVVGGPHTSTRIRAPPGGQTSFSIGWN